VVAGGGQLAGPAGQPGREPHDRPVLVGDGLDVRAVPPLLAAVGGSAVAQLVARRRAGPASRACGRSSAGRRDNHEASCISR
jgi:hypothetical protein